LSKLDVVQELHVASKALWDIQTNSLVERIAETVEKASQVMDHLMRPETLLLLERLEKSAPLLSRMLDIMDTGDKTGALSAFLDLGTALKAIQNLGVDSLIERIATQTEKTTDLLDRFSNLPIDDLTELASKLKSSGGFETLPELVGAVSAIRRLLTDSLVEKIMLITEQAVSWQGNVATIFKSIPPPPHESPGVIGVIALLRDPETQKSLAYFLNGVKSIQNAIKTIK
ncbi:MAG: helical membrane plugin domain-containing protein, partial [Leptospirales bacterium]